MQGTIEWGVLGMKLFLAAIFLLPLASAGYIPGKQCGGVVCLNDTDVTCIPQNNYCRCKDRLWGNGRFACVDRSYTCLCYLFGDPYVTGFSGSVMAAPIPCRHVLAEFTTPSGVQIKISGSGGRRTDRKYPGFVLEDEVYFRAKKGKTVGHADIRRSGFYNKGLRVPLPVAENFPDFGLTCYGEYDTHYWRLELPRHAVVLRYRSADSSVTIQTPKDSKFVSNRLCGDCNDSPSHYRNEARRMKLTNKEWSFYTTALNLDTEHEEDKDCKALGEAVNGLTDEKVDTLTFCGAPFSHDDIGECYTEAFGKAETLRKTTGCLEGNKDQWCADAKKAKDGCSNKDVDFSVIDKGCQ